MNRRQFLYKSAGPLLLGLSATSLGACTRANYVTPQSPLRRAAFTGRTAKEAALQAQVTAAGFASGAPLHLMAFKQERLLEIWMQRPNGRYGLFDTLDICAYSGDLGPKLAEGDQQTPEGFYTIGPRDLYPDSDYHLALDIGFPNVFDRAQGRTGSLIRIHGGCESIGCYALGDAGVERAYLLTEAALRQGSAYITFAAYPFRPTSARLAATRGHIWHDFWKTLSRSYTLFMLTRRPPEALLWNKAYFFIPEII